MRIDARPADEAVAAVERGLEALARGFTAGDVRPKAYARQRQDLLATLGKNKIGPSLQAGETILAEHHWIEAYSRIPMSPLKETAQVACSLYATDRRLYWWRFQDRARPDAALLEDCDERLEFQWYEDIHAARPRLRPRWGEALTGAVIAVLAWLAAGHLSVSGPLLIAVGVFGVVHGLAVPTRTVLLEMRDPGEAPWVVWSTTTRSGRRLLAHIRGRLVADPTP